MPVHKQILSNVLLNAIKSEKISFYHVVLLPSSSVQNMYFFLYYNVLYLFGFICIILSS